jgi:hypothetical protein
MVQPLFASGTAALLLTAAFSLAVAAITSRFWSIRGIYDASDPPNLTGYAARSPFSICSLALGNGTAWNCQHTKKPGGLCDPLHGGNDDSFILCQTLGVCGRLLIAACVLLGVGFLTSIGLVLATTAKGNTTVRRALALGAFLLAATGAICMAIAQLAGVLGLLMQQFPNPEDGTSIVSPTDILSTWTGHSGMSLAVASWILAAFAAVSAALLLGWTRHGRDGHLPHHNHHDGHSHSRTEAKD